MTRAQARPGILGDLEFLRSDVDLPFDHLNLRFLSNSTSSIAVRSESPELSPQILQYGMSALSFLHKLYILQAAFSRFVPVNKPRSLSDLRRLTYSAIRAPHSSLSSPLPLSSTVSLCNASRPRRKQLEASSCQNRVSRN